VSKKRDRNYDRRSGKIQHGSYLGESSQGEKIRGGKSDEKKDRKKSIGGRRNENLWKN